MDVKYDAITLTTMLLMLMLRLPGEVRGDDCADKRMDCLMKINAEMEKVGSVLQRNPPNISAALTECGSIETVLRTCERELRAVCSNAVVDSTMGEINTVHKSICGQETICTYRLSLCQPDFSVLGEMAAAMQQTPPDMAFVMERCREMNTTVIQCVEELKPDCGNTPNFTSSVESLSSAIMDICSTGEATQCPQVWRCLTAGRNKEDCSGHGSLVGCVADLKGTCELTEEAITFKAVEALSLQFCTELKKSKGGEENCTSLGLCMMGSELARKMYGGGSSSQPQLHISLLLDSRTWCQYLNVMADCYISSADKCQLDASVTSYMTHQHEHLSTVCPLSSSYGEKQAASNLIFILLLAIFTAWGRLCLD